MLSHHHECIFVHVPKCGGMSVENLFLQDLGLSWDQRAPLLLRERIGNEDAPPRLAHLTAMDYVAKGYVSQALFDAYLTFAVVRDPFTRTASLYRYLAFDWIMTFEAFVTDHLPSVLADPDHPWHWFLRPQADFVTGPAGELLVDVVVRLESLGADLPPVLAKVGLDVESVPHVNKVGRVRRRRKARLAAGYALGERRLPSLLPGSRHPTWNDATSAALAQSYGDDFSLFGYSSACPR